MVTSHQDEVREHDLALSLYRIPAKYITGHRLADTLGLYTSDKYPTRVKDVGD